MTDITTTRLTCAIVLRVREDGCDVVSGGAVHAVAFAPMFPSPRTERVQPGNLVALDAGTITWRWYDAVVLDPGTDVVRLWEPAHGEVLATPRPSYVAVAPGARAYLSAGLPGADWWVAGPAVANAEDADVELDEVLALFAA